jgi:hypothetical protein
VIIFNLFYVAFLLLNYVRRSVRCEFVERRLTCTARRLVHASHACMHYVTPGLKERFLKKKKKRGKKSTWSSVERDAAGLCRLGIRLSASPVWCGAAHLNSTCTGPWPCTPCAADRIPGYALCLLSIGNPFAQQATTPAEVQSRPGNASCMHVCVALVAARQLGLLMAKNPIHSHPYPNLITLISISHPTKNTRGKLNPTHPITLLIPNQPVRPCSAIWDSFPG